MTIFFGLGGAVVSKNPASARRGRARTRPGRAGMTMAALVAAASILAASATSMAQLEKPAPVDARTDAGPAHAGAMTDLPVREVALFSSGVGYFEHEGLVHGNATAELRFKTDQINDVLKSLVLQDLDHGQVGVVTYPSPEPLAKTLKSFQVDITANPPMADLLNQLRGAKISLEAEEAGGRKTYEGIIVGVEDHRRSTGPADRPEVIDAWQLNLKVGRTFRAIELASISSFEFADPKLDQEMDRALSAVAQSRDQEKKPVTISFHGQGDRHVRVGYVVETPVWKTSYRLILTGPEDKPGADTRPAHPTTRPAAAGGKKVAEEGKLQGWAIVENQTDNDWNDVQLSLVSGRPISFIEDLYHPLYVPRPIVFPDLYLSLRPQTYAGGLNDEEQQKMNLARNQSNENIERQTNNGQATRTGGLGGDGLFGGAPTTSPRAGTPAPAPIDPTASVAAAAAAGQLGELFEYTVGDVSLPRQKSAMIPIVTDPIEVEKVSIYNASVLPAHPLYGARVTNTTHKHLLQGPVTVFEDGGYAGDARIDDVPPGQRRLLSYGVDLNVFADLSEPRSESSVETGKIVNGVLQVTVKIVGEQSYTFQNKGSTPRTIIVEQPRDASMKLIEPASAEETTPDLYRFKIHVDPHASAKLTVRDAYPGQSEFELTKNDPGSLAVYIKEQSIPAKVRAALEKIAAIQIDVVNLQEQIDQRQKTIMAITVEQSRIRDDMKSVASNSDYYNRLLKKLDAQETTIETTQKESAALTTKHDQDNAQLEAYVTGLNIE